MTRILSVLIFVQLATHQSRMESLSASISVQSVAEFTVGKILILSTKKKSRVINFWRRNYFF